MWHKRLGSHFVAVYSSPVSPPEKSRVLAEAQACWPFVRMVRDDRHWPEHAQFSSRDFGHSRRLETGDRQRAEDEARSIERELPEWSRRFPALTFAVIEIDNALDWSSGGFVCRDGQQLLCREFSRKPHAYDLIDKIGLPDRNFDPFSPRYFWSLRDLVTEWLAELEVVQDYCAKMESTLFNEWREYQERSQGDFDPNWHEDLDDPIDYLEGLHKEQDETSDWYQITLTQELRRSVLVSSYCLLEQALSSLCWYLYRHREKVPGLSSASDPGPSGIFRAQKFLKAIIPEVYDPGRVWNEIEQYNVIRNWIVHRGREVSEGAEEQTEKREELMDVLGRRSDVQVEHGRLILLPDMCQTAVQRMQAFLKELAAAWSRWEPL